MNVHTPGAVRVYTLWALIASMLLISLMGAVVAVANRNDMGHTRSVCFQLGFMEICKGERL